jgi:hypothetical protein
VPEDVSEGERQKKKFKRGVIVNQIRDEEVTSRARDMDVACIYFMVVGAIIRGPDVAQEGCTCA